MYARKLVGSTLIRKRNATGRRPIDHRGGEGQEPAARNRRPRDAGRAGDPGPQAIVDERPRGDAEEHGEQHAREGVDRRPDHERERARPDTSMPNVKAPEAAARAANNGARGREGAARRPRERLSPVRASAASSLQRQASGADHEVHEAAAATNVPVTPSAGRSTNGPRATPEGRRRACWRDRGGRGLWAVATPAGRTSTARGTVAPRSTVGGRRTGRRQAPRAARIRGTVRLRSGSAAA